LSDPLQPGVVLYGDYRITATGSAYNTGIGAEPSSRVAANTVDYFGAPRPTLLRVPGYDIGATQVAGVLPIGGVIPPFLALRTAALTTAANTVAAKRPAFLAAAPASAPTPTPAPASAAGASALIAIAAPTNQTALPVARLSGLTPALIHSPLNCSMHGQPACGTGTLQLSNTGGAALAIANIMSSNAAFSIANNCGSSLAAGGTCLITVTFNPPKNGLPVNGTAVVRNNSGGVTNNTQIATLSGAVR
jgi:hypothetical protein